MEFNNELDIQIAKQMLKFPLLGQHIESKWHLDFHREFHMTGDSKLFLAEKKQERLPLYEGKMIFQFTHNLAEPRYWIDAEEGRKALLKRTPDKGQILGYQKYRLAYRSIAANTNERTFICTVIPPCFAGHSLNVAENIEGKTLFVGASFLSSFVLDWFLRQKVTANISVFYVYQLPVPRLTQGDRFFAAIVERAARLICTTPEFDDLAKEVGLTPVGAFGERPFSERPSYTHPQMGVRQTPVQYGVTEPFARARLRAELDGMIAHLYELTEVEFAHILNSFPLVPEAVKVAARNAWRDVDRGILV